MNPRALEASGLGRDRNEQSSASASRGQRGQLNQGFGKALRVPSFRRGLRGLLGVFDAFDGSLVDTICMILIPLVITARLVPANVWPYPRRLKATKPPLASPSGRI